jgi:8-oxo-dGTP pyrophosphatase MutT (NUDIX family)
MQRTLEHSELKNPRDLIRHIESRLNGNGIAANWLGAGSSDSGKGSAVLFLLTQRGAGLSGEPEPCLLLNKRSQRVLQPGDLCCPGGGVATSDKFLSRLMRLPFSPLYNWSQWPRWRVEHPKIAQRLALLLTTGLREAWEEMRLNPLKVSFMGPLPVQQLVLFKRHIFPLAAWVPSYQRLKPNWEVERLVHVPLRQLLDPGNFGRYRLTFNTGQGEPERQNDFPCFIHQGEQGTEILWGATFRIAADFLKLVFGFCLPDPDTLPVVQGKRGKTYLNGSLWELKGLLKEEGEHDY